MFLNRLKINESLKYQDEIDIIFRFIQISLKFDETILNLV